ncbi:MAG: hypothetical protein IPN17_18320 [Deltaproteobacteria bacterium]|nr:hypothetical protein [Deltaproteobacteria bacterium]MBK7063923.1 hypothetical protein [Deltaproteobacteria bacterium]MBK8694179.1 hypothetical protein [Deltaproteobacteria bacterium]MBP6832277.1 hypothetical protein [Deltaproteobacteria bacterium]
MNPSTHSLALALALCLAPTVAVAQTTAPPGPMARARYSLPWNLRPAIAPNLLRLDVAVAFNAAGTNTATIFTAGGKPIASLPDLGFYGRVGAVTFGPDATSGHATFVNPIVFALWTPQIAAGVRLPVFLGVTVPVGTGSAASPLQRSTFASGIYTRQAMDNALFAANYLTVTAGAGLSWMSHGLTLQAEATVLQLTRVWGASVDADSSRTNFTTGFHAGYQVVPWLTVSVEGHYQHWLSTPAAVTANALMRSQFTVGGGVRGNIPAGSVLLRPGVAVFFPTGGQMRAADATILQFDLAAPF